MKNISLSNKLFCASLNYQRLDQKALANLDSALLNIEKKSFESFKEKLGFTIDSIALIKKCNALIIVISYQEDLSIEFIKGRLLTTWDADSKNGIANIARDIRFFQDIEALRFLAESAMGLHSVVTGDSQVFSQVIDGLRNGIDNGKLFKIIIEWLNNILHKIKEKTHIFDGNISLERIACDLLSTNVPNTKKIMVIGYGNSGKLITKILSKEHNYPLLILNRTKVAQSHRLQSNSKEIIYSDFFENNTFEDIAGVIVAITNNKSTREIINKLIAKLPNEEKTYFIDISTPPVLTSSVGSFVDITTLSKRADANLHAREKEVSKVKNVINENLFLVVATLNKEIARLYLDNQEVNFNKLDKEKLKLMTYRSEMYKSIRKLLETKKYIEVTTPYIVGISTDPPKIDDGGTINIDWQNDTSAFLRQSNQIYKQILVASGIKKIYEIGPFWRKETIESYRHLQESIGLDIEISQPRSLENLYVIACEIIRSVNSELVKKFKLKNKLILPEMKKIPVFTYLEAIKMLQGNGNPVVVGDDLGLVGEAKLGQLIYRKYNSSICIIKNYPDTIKKFYTKNKYKGLTETFDIIVDGWELVSGAIRQTDGTLIKKSMMLSGIPVKNYSFYLSIVDKAIEHGGFCIGLDRLMAKILNKEMVSDAVLFPRTTKKLIP